MFHDPILVVVLRLFHKFLKCQLLRNQWRMLKVLLPLLIPFQLQEPLKTEFQLLVQPLWQYQLPINQPKLKTQNSFIQCYMTLRAMNSWSKRPIIIVLQPQSLIPLGHLYPLLVMNSNFLFLFYFLLLFFSIFRIRKLRAMIVIER